VTAPDPDLLADFAACMRDSPHVRTLVGLMEQKGIRFVPVNGTSHHGVPWSAIVVQGQPDVQVLQQAAAKIAELLEAERVRLRAIAERG